MTRDQVIDRVLGHTAGDFVGRQCRAAPTEADAVAFLRAHLIPSGYIGSDGAWHGQRVGVAYTGPDGAVLPTVETGAAVVPWIEIARAARGARQLTMEDA